MSIKRYVVRLTIDERAELSALVKTGKKIAAKKRMHAQVLLKVDQGETGPGWTDAKVSEALDIHTNTVKRIRQQLVEGGLASALDRKKRKHPARPRKLDGAAEARLIATVQGPPPQGRAKWTLRLLSDKLVELGISDEPASYATIGRVLKKMR
jgi:transposase